MKPEERLRQDVLKDPKKYGFKRIILSQRYCPDLVVEDLEGKILRVELEDNAEAFAQHHNPDVSVDLILANTAYITTSKIFGFPVRALTLRERYTKHFNTIRANIDVPDYIWIKFTQKVLEKYGKVRDERNKAVAEALSDWVKKP